MKRLTAIPALAVLLVALSAPMAIADTAEPTDEPTAGSDSSGADANPVSPYVQPSIVYVSVTWTGYIYDTFQGYKDYIRPGGEGDAKKFTVGFRCTGFVVNPDGYIATAGHCVDPNEASIRDAFIEQAAVFATTRDPAYSNLSVQDFIDTEDDYRVDGYDAETDTVHKGRPDRAVSTAWSVSAGGVDTGEVYPAIVRKFQPFDKGDAAILKIDKTDLTAIEFSEATELAPQTPVVAVGYPGSVDMVTDPSLETPTFTDGTISSERTIQDGLLTVYGISAQVSGGMSGGPTVDSDGKVIGINSFGIDPSVETQSFNFIRPTQNLIDVMSDAGVENELSETTQTYNAGLDAYFAEDKEGAVEALQTVVDEQPTNQMAADYLAKANDLADAPASDSSDSGDGFPYALVGGIAAGVLVLIGLVVFLLARRGKSGASGQGGPSQAMPTGPAPGGDGGWATPPAAPGQPAQAPTTQMPAGPVAPVTAQAAPTPQAAEPPPARPPAHAAPTASAPATPPAPPAAPPAAPETVGFRPAGAEPAAPVAPVEQQVQAPPAVPEQAHAFCGTCGTRAVAGQKFCGNCGATL